MRTDKPMNSTPNPGEHADLHSEPATMTTCGVCGDSYRGGSHECEPKILMCLRIVRDEPDDGPTVHFRVRKRDLENPGNFFRFYLEPALIEIRKRL